MPTINDATVVASAYDTSGNGGRKLVRLKSGRLVAVVRKPTSMYQLLLEYTDNNWATKTEVTVLSTSNTLVDACLETDGVNVFVLLNQKWSGAGSTTFRSYNGSTMTLIGSATTLDSAGVTDVGNCSMILNGSNLESTWSNKNSTYSSSFNIRYAKGTINADGSVTWGVVEQITVENTSGRDVRNPSLTLDKDSKPIIIVEHFDGTNYVIRRWKKDVSWSQVPIYTTTYVQSSSSVIFVPQSINGLANGRIWVAWYGYDSTDTTTYGIKVSYSDDGGVTWSAMTKITSVAIDGTQFQMHPSMTFSKNGDVWIVWQGNNNGSAYYQMRAVKYSNGIWGSKQELTTGTTSRQYASTLCDPTFSFSSPLFIYKDSAKVGFYGIWTVITPSVPVGHLGVKSDKTNLLTLNITTDGTPSTSYAYVNGLPFNYFPNGQPIVFNLDQETWDSVVYGKLSPDWSQTILPDTYEWESESAYGDDWNTLYLSTSGQQGAYIKAIIPIIESSKPHFLTFKSFGLETLPDGYVEVSTSDDSINFGPSDIVAKEKLRKDEKTQVITIPPEMLTKNYLSVQFYTYYSSSGDEYFISDIYLSHTIQKNTLKVSYGAEEFLYTFEKQLANTDDILSTVKAIKDTKTVVLPNIKKNLATAIRGKGGSINDTDSFDTMMNAIKSMEIKAEGTLTIVGQDFTITGLSFKPKLAIAMQTGSPTVYGFVFKHDLINGDIGGLVGGTFYKDNALWKINNDGFTMRMPSTGINVTWKAYG